MVTGPPLEQIIQRPTLRLATQLAADNAAEVPDATVATLCHPTDLAVDRKVTPNPNLNPNRSSRGPQGNTGAAAGCRLSGAAGRATCTS